MWLLLLKGKMQMVEWCYICDVLMLIFVQAHTYIIHRQLILFHINSS